MTTAHTATPWAVEQMPSGRTTITSRQFFVAGDDNSHGIHQGNAEFIVRACNAHDDLVEALQALVTTFDPNKQSMYEFARPKIEAARAALAKAGA